MIVLMMFLCFTIPEWIPSLSLLFFYSLLRVFSFQWKGVSRILSLFPSLRNTAWICLGTGILYWIYWNLEPFLQHTNFPAYGAVLGAKVLGHKAYHAYDSIALSRLGDTVFWGTSPRHAYLYPFLSAFVLAGSMLIGLRSTLLKKGLLALLLAGFVLVYREGFVLGSLLYQSKLGDVPPDTQNDVFLPGMALLPLFIIWSSFIPRFHDTKECTVEEQTGTWRSGRISASLQTVLIALAVFCFLWTPPGIYKSGKIAVDGAHSDWEWTDVPMNKDLFGTKTTYNFVSLIRLLDQQFASAENVTEETLTDKILRRYDVWVLKTPTRPYSPEETEALVRYVEKGGSLYLIGEHTDIFGINTCLNQVSGHFGIRFVSDSLMDDATRRYQYRQLWERPPGGYHPIVTNVPEFLFATSCSIDADPFRCRPVMTGTGLYSDVSDYSKMTFFGDMKRDSIEPYGRFHQCVTARYGKGRVAAFTDSTTFSSFSMQVKGKPELAVGTVKWLNHMNASCGFLRVTAAAALAAAVFMIIYIRIKRGRLPEYIVWGVIAGSVFGLAGARTAEKIWVEYNPRPEWTLPRAAFLTTSEYTLPHRYQVHHDEVSDSIYSTFYAWFQRAGVMPFMVDTIEEAQDHQMLVMLDFDRKPEESELELLKKYLDKGGSLWVLSIHQPLLERLFTLLLPETDCSIVDLEQGVQERIRAFDEFNKRWIEIPAPEKALKGIEPVLTTEEGFILQGQTDAGQGKLILTTIPRMFSNREMGTPTDIPTEERYALFHVEWNAIAYALSEDR